MAEGLDILNDNTAVDLSTVRTSLPILAAGMYVVTLKAASVDANKKGTGSNLSLEVTLTNPALDDQGKEVAPGFPLFDTVSLVRTFKPDGTTISYDPVKRLVELLEAFGVEKAGSMTPRDMLALIQSFIGQQTAVRTKIEKSDEYGDKTRIQRYSKLA